jgi:PAS domain S-box-containing protein
LFLLDGEVSTDILQMVGTHCSIALKNALTLERLEKRNQELSALHSITTLAAKTPEIESIISDIIKEIAGIFAASGVVIFKTQESTGQLQLVGQTGLSEKLKKHMEPPLASEFINFLSSTESLASGNMNDFIARDPELAADCAHETLPWFMTAVIDINGHRTGTISVVRYQKNDFLSHEKSLLVAISNQLSLAFENARLHRNLVQRIQDLETTRNMLTQSEEKMHLTIDSLSEGIMITSIDGRIIQANEPAARLHGYNSNDHFVGTHSLRYVDPADRRKMLDNLKIILETGNPKIAEYTLIKKDNSRFLTECNISIYKDFLGKPGGFVICIRDISVRRQAEKRLQDSERKYRLIAENTNDYIAMLSFSGYYTYASPSYRQLGYEPGELIGKSGLNLIHPEDHKSILPLLLKFSQMDAADLNRARSANYTQRLEYRITDKTGAWHYLFTTGNVIESLDGRGFNILLISHDVTDLKRAEDDLKQSYNSEKEARRALEMEISKRADFFRALVHELKTPLTPIMVSSEALIDLMSEPTFKNLARNVYNGASRLNERVDELLDIARGERGMLKVNREPMSMEILIHDVANYIRPQTMQNRQDFKVDIPAPLPTIMGDETRLRQVLLNLLDNAIKFTPERGQIVLRAIADDDNLMVKVQDTGCGIDTSDQERLFQPYNRIEDDRQHFSGLGLGLALCKQLVDLHEGRLWIESQKGKGTSFFFSLPTAKQGNREVGYNQQSGSSQQVNSQSINQG